MSSTSEFLAVAPKGGHVFTVAAAALAVALAAAALAAALALAVAPTQALAGH